MKKYLIALILLALLLMLSSCSATHVGEAPAESDSNANVAIGNVTEQATSTPAPTVAIPTPTVAAPAPTPVTPLTVIADISEASMLSTIADLSEEARPINSEVLNEAAEKITNTLTALGYKTRRQDFDYSLKEASFAALRNPDIFYADDPTDEDVDGSSCNIIATKPCGNDNTNLLVISAHYDGAEDSAGANDNGSGVAVVIELARLLKDVQLSFDVEFVLYSGEERLFLGSKRYVRDMSEYDKSRLIGNINIDTIGCKSDLGYNAVVYGDNRYDDPNADHAPLNTNAMSDLFESEPRITTTLMFNSDHVAFSTAGLPSVSVVQDLSEGIELHSAEDSIDKIDVNRLVEVTTFVLTAIAKLDSNSVGLKDNKIIGTEILRRESLGGIHVGMAQEAVIALFGKPYDESNSGAIEDSDGNRFMCYFYRSPDVTYPNGKLYDFVVEFVDQGGGNVVNRIYALNHSTLVTKSGIRIGSSITDVETAYDDIINKEKRKFDPECIMIGEHENGIWFSVQDGKVTYIELGCLVPWSGESEIK